MKKLEWIALLCVGLATGMLFTPPSHAAAQQPAKAQIAQVQAGINLLLTGDDNHQLFLPVVVR